MPVAKKQNCKEKNKVQSKNSCTFFINGFNWNKKCSNLFTFFKCKSNVVWHWKRLFIIHSSVWFYQWTQCSRVQKKVHLRAEWCVRTGDKCHLYSGWPAENAATVFEGHCFHYPLSECKVADMERFNTGLFYGLEHLLTPAPKPFVSVCICSAQELALHLGQAVKE